MIKKEKELLTKAVKGLRTADAANAAVRYVLWALTEKYKGIQDELEEKASEIRMSIMGD